MAATPRRRKSPDVRRQEILDAVLEIGADRGLEAVSARDVAEHVGVAPGLIHHYFPSMDELLAESFGKWADGILENLRRHSQSANPRVSLALLVADLSPDQRIWNNALSTAPRYRKLRERSRQLSMAYLEDVTAIIAAGVDQGTFSCASPHESAWRIILILDGLVAMVHILGLITREEIPSLVGPVVEHELGLETAAFTELVQGLMNAEALSL